MRRTTIFFLLSISAAYAGEEKTIKRGVFGEQYSNSDGRLDWPHIHKHNTYLPLEGENASEGSDGHIPSASPNVDHGAPFQQSTGPGVPAGQSIAPEVPQGGSLVPGGVIPLGRYIDLGRTVQRHIQVINKVGIPIAQPYPVQVERRIPVRVPQPVDVPVDRPYPVRVPVEVPIKIFKDVPYPVEKRIPVPVKVHVRVPVEVPYKVFHSKPVPVPVWKKVPVPVPDPIIVKKRVPVAIHTHLVPLRDHHINHQKWW